MEMNEIKRLRELRRWTQGDLAEASGVSDATVSAYERGTRQWNSKSLDPIARALGVETWELLKPGEEYDLTAMELLEAMEKRLESEPDRDPGIRKEVEMLISLLKLKLKK